MKTHLEKLAEFVSGLEYSKIPAVTIRAARLQVLDMVAAVYASGSSGGVKTLLGAVDGFSSPGGRSTVLLTGKRHGPADAALANALCSMAFDFDDIVWMGHTCHSAVFASLAVAEQEGRSVRDFLTAVVAANEVGGRLGASCIFGPLNGQMWTFIHLAGAAAATSRLLGLDAGRTAHALAVALSQPTFPLQPGFLRPTSKLLAAGIPASTGIAAAYFARSGMTGNPQILEAPKGFWSRFSYLPLPPMLDMLGEFWVTDTLTVKTYPGCHYHQTALAALDKICVEHGRPAISDVKSILIETTKLAVEATKFAGELVDSEHPATAVSAAFDLALAAAVLLHSGSLSTETLTDEFLGRNREALGEWTRRIRVVHDPLLTAEVIRCARGIPLGERSIKTLTPVGVAGLIGRYRDEYKSNLFSLRDASKTIAGYLRRRRPEDQAPLPKSGPPPLSFPSRVTVMFRDGRRVTERMDLPLGSLANPGMEDELRSKFLRETGKILGEKRAYSAFQTGLKMEEMTLAVLVRSVTADA